MTSTSTEHAAMGTVERVVGDPARTEAAAAQVACGGDAVVGGPRVVVAQSWDVPVEVGDPERVDPRHLHAVVSRRLDGLVPAGGHWSATKQYSVGPLWERPDGRPGFALRVVGRGWLGPCQRDEVDLGRQQARIGWPEASLIDELTLTDLDRLVPVKSVLVRFVSPMARRQGDHYSPNPTPEGVLGSWERAAAGVELGERVDPACRPVLGDRVDWRGGRARIVHLDGHTVEWSGVKGPWRKARPIGFVGELALVVDPEHRRRLHQLARLAAFAGTGAHTTFGMGLTELVSVEEWEAAS